MVWWNVWNYINPLSRKNGPIPVADPGFPDNRGANFGSENSVCICQDSIVMDISAFHFKTPYDITWDCITITRCSQLRWCTSLLTISEKYSIILYQQLGLIRLIACIIRNNNVNMQTLVCDELDWNDEHDSKLSSVSRRRLENCGRLAYYGAGSFVTLFVLVSCGKRSELEFMQN